MKPVVYYTLLVILIFCTNITNTQAHNLWAWGNNEYGRLGDGTLTHRSTPEQIGILNNWVQVAAGQYHALAIKSDGSLWAWGRNEKGQLGDGTNITRKKPVRIGTGNDWAFVAAGMEHSLAIKTNGTLWAWGWNQAGQLGDSSITDKNVPVQVGSANDWVRITCGVLHSLAIKADGTLWGWGGNAYYVLGDSTYISFIVPKQIGTDPDWALVSTINIHTLAVKTDGTLWAWGNNDFQQLGDGTRITRKVPTQIGISSNWSAVSSGSNHSLALQRDGTLWAWGSNQFGCLGDSTTSGSIPVQIGTENNWLAVSAGSALSLGLKSNHTVWSWGWNYWGQLGDGTTVEKHIPIQVGTDTSWVFICAGEESSYALGSAIAKNIFISSVPLAVCPGGSISIKFTLNSSYNPGNIFTAQLSDSTGDFTNPINIGTISSSTQGTINATIPDSVKPGKGYRVRIISSNPSFTGSDNEFDIMVDNFPNAVFNDFANSCEKNSYLYTTPNIAGYTYKWSVTNGTIVGTSTNNTCSIKWNNLETGKVKLIVTNSTSCKDTLEKTIQIKPLPTLEIIGPDTVCANSEGSYHCLLENDRNYKWKAINGIPIGSDTSRYVTVQWNKTGAYQIRLIKTIISTGCIDSLTKNIVVLPLPKPAITGNKYVCSGNIEKYKGSLDSNIQNRWKVTGGTLLGEIINTREPEIIWREEGRGTIKLILTNKVTGCTDSIIDTVTINPKPKPKVTGSGSVCSNLTEIYRTNTDNALTNLWEATGGTIIGANNKTSASVKWGLSGTGSVKLVQVNKTTGCMDSVIMNITISDKLHPTITGSIEVCENSGETYSASSSTEISNTWYITGGTVSGPDYESTLNVFWGKAGTGRIKLIQKIIASGTVDSVVQSVKIKSMPIKPVISRNGKNLTSSSTTGNQWYLNGVKLQDSTANIIYPTQSGRYQIQVTQNGCQSEISDEYYYDINDVKEQDITGIRIYPNPVNNDVLNIELGGNPHQTIIYEIISPLGITVQKGEINESLTRLSLVHQASGVYCLILKQNEKQEVSKFIINR